MRSVKVPPTSTPNRFIALPSRLEDDLSEEVPSRHDVHRLRGFLERERRGNLGLQRPAGDEAEARLRLCTSEDERADNRQLPAEERDDVERHDLAAVRAADHEPAVLAERVE